MFTLSIGGVDQPYRDQSLEALLTETASEQIEFLILSNDESTSYVQAAGAYGALVVERRLVAANSHRHVKFCRAGASTARRPPRVKGYQGYMEKEVLSVAEAVSLFTAFLRGEDAVGFEELETAM